MDKMKNSISVVLVTHNRNKFLKKSLCSIINQTHTPDEIIVVDNSDSDYLLKNELIINEISNKISLNYYQNNDIKGASYSRNLGASKANGEYLAFLDDDDWWSENYLYEINLILNKNIADLILSWFIEVKKGIYYDEKKPGNKLTKNNFLYKNPGLRGSNLFISKKIFDKIRGFDVELMSMNDLDIGYRLFSLEKLIYFPLKKKLVFFNNHDSSERLSTPGSYNKIIGIKKFWYKYKDNMNNIEKKFFIKKAWKLWNVKI